MDYNTIRSLAFFQIAYYSCAKVSSFFGTQLKSTKTYIKMKNISKNICRIFCLLVVVVISSCGGGTGTKMKDNAFFGKLPSMAKEYVSYQSEIEDKIDELGKQANDSDNPEKLWEKARKLDDEKNEFAETCEQKICDYLKSNNLVGKSLPFEQAACEDLFTVKEIKITEATEGNVKYNELGSVSFDIIFEPKGVKKREALYYKVVDKNGEILYHSSSYISDPAKGKTNSGFSGPNLAKLEDFAKIVIIDKDEYLTFI